MVTNRTAVLRHHRQNRGPLGRVPYCEEMTLTCTAGASMVGKIVNTQGATKSLSYPDAATYSPVGCARDPFPL